MIINTGARAATPKPETPPVAISKTYVPPAPVAAAEPGPVETGPIALEIFDGIDQGSDEWHDIRRGIVTASIVGKLITEKTMKPARNETSRGIALTLAAERITGRTDPSAQSRDMLRGTLDEPYARDEYSKQKAPAVETGFMIRSDLGFQIGYSPDGLVDENGLIEIKSRAQKAHVKNVLDNKVPAENMAQIQCGLLVSGRKWCDYVDYTSGMALWTVRVYPDASWQRAIIEAVAATEEIITEYVLDYEKATEGLPLTEYVDHFEFDDVELKLS